MIRLTKQTDYALVLLTHMASRGSEETHTARGLADETQISLPMVSKILKALGRGGLLASTRGARGGYTLGSNPEGITVVDIIQALEGPISLTECSVHSDSVCSIEGCCPVSSNMQRINRTVVEALEKLSLEELAKPVRESTRRFHPPSKSDSAQVAGSQ